MRTDRDDPFAFWNAFPANGSDGEQANEPHCAWFAMMLDPINEVVFDVAPETRRQSPGIRYAIPCGSGVAMAFRQHFSISRCNLRGDVEPYVQGGTNAAADALAKAAIFLDGAPDLLDEVGSPLLELWKIRLMQESFRDYRVELHGNVDR